MLLVVTIKIVSSHRTGLFFLSSCCSDDKTTDYLRLVRKCSLVRSAITEQTCKQCVTCDGRRMLLCAAPGSSAARRIPQNRCVLERRSSTKATTDLNCLKFHHEGLTGGFQVIVARTIGLSAVPPCAHQSFSTSAPSTKAAAEQNKNDISGFLPGGGTRSVDADKTQPGTTGTPPLRTTTKARQFRKVQNAKGNIQFDLLNPVKRIGLFFLCFGRDFNSWDL